MPLFIHPHLSLPDQELVFTAMRSSGPGGQNVNKVNSAVRLSFDVENSPTLSAGQKQRLKQKLSHRLTREGVLAVVCQRERSQLLNKEIATERLQSVLQEALKRQPRRKKTRISRGKLKARKEANIKAKAKKKRRGNLNLRKLDL